VGPFCLDYGQAERGLYRQDCGCGGRGLYSPIEAGLKGIVMEMERGMYVASIMVIVRGF
jgi:hypothetical protein